MRNPNEVAKVVSDILSRYPDMIARLEAADESHEDAVEFAVSAFRDSLKSFSVPELVAFLADDASVKFSKRPARAEVVAAVVEFYAPR